MSRKTISLDDAKQSLDSLLAELKEGAEPVFVTDGGDEPAAVLLSHRAYTDLYDEMRRLENEEPVKSYFAADRKRRAAKGEVIEETLPQTMAVADFERNLESLARDSAKGESTVIVERNGTPLAVFMLYGDYDGFLETIDILHNPDEVREIVEAGFAMDRGEYLTYEEVFGEKEKAARKAG